MKYNSHHNQTNHRRLGMNQEILACEFLKNNGYDIIESNFRCRLGEIDIIADNEGYLCFVEVKYRKNKYSGYAAESVNIKKQQIILKVANFYYTRYKIPMSRPARFDVVAIDNNNISLIKNAFGGI